ncbi:MAG TPA: hypothetical protein VKR31_07205 [Rhizomicrobium sp.]|nr:hypothetical protein [Rhizomicrobium sp.]
MEVVKLDDYRKPTRDLDEKLGYAVTFYAAVFAIAQGVYKTLSLTINTATGDEVEPLIERVKAEGGVGLPKEEGDDTIWFIPWPPSAISIRPIEPN